MFSYEGIFKGGQKETFKFSNSRKPLLLWLIRILLLNVKNRVIRLNRMSNNSYRQLFSTLMGPCTEVLISSLDFSHLMSCSILCLTISDHQGGSVGLEACLGLLFPFSNLLRCCRSFIFPNFLGCGFLIFLSASTCRTQFSLPSSCCAGKEHYFLQQPFVQASTQTFLQKKGTLFNKPKKKNHL